MFPVIIVLPLFICTLANPAPEPPGRILGGQNAKLGQLPYMLNLKLNGEHFCGAALISGNIALTAAHCTNGKSADNFTVTGGTLKLGGTTGVTIQVDRIEQHASFNSTTYAYDISILFLKNNFTLDNNIATVALPSAYDFVPGNGSGTVSGWGMDESGEEPEDLKFANIPVWWEQKCFPYQCRRRSPIYCAGDLSGQPNACGGDSGGPLVYNNMLVGVVSDGFDCGTKDLPVLYTKVAGHFHWIVERTGL